jgi:CRISPR system Cascade subunit CasA
MAASFNLVERPWIPLSGKGLVSLSDIFEAKENNSMSGNPVLKIATYKLLFAIAQSAFTPKDEDERCAVGIDGFISKCREYLNRHAHLFDLYGDKPFLQIPAIKAAKEVSFSVIQNEIASGNTIRVSHCQIGNSLSRAEIAQLLLTQMSMSMGGKKTDNSVVLTEGYTGKINEKGKSSTGKPGPGTGFMGLLHSFVITENILETLWVNLLSHEQISAESMFESGVGVAPWLSMPSGEDCSVARALKTSLIGRLVPLSRFCLLTENGVHFSEGILHRTYLEGMSDPTVSVNTHGKKVKVLWANPSLRPWRELPALLSFIDNQGKGSFYSFQLKAGVEQAVRSGVKFAVWSGGLRVTANAGEQFVSGTDGYVESTIWLDSGIIGEPFFAQLKKEMGVMSSMSKSLYACVCAYYAEIGALPSGPDYASRATGLYWNLCENEFNELVMACDQTEQGMETIAKIRRNIIGHCQDAYSSICSHETSRQVQAWAKYQPNLKKYLKVD